MLKKIADNRDERSLSVQFRKKRFVFFNSLLSRLDRPVHILDIGGTESYWKTMGMDDDEQVFITLLNLSKDDVTLPNLILSSRTPFPFPIFSVFAIISTGWLAAEL
jgi:hypothetical protein